MIKMYTVRFNALNIYKKTILHSEIGKRDKRGAMGHFFPNGSPGMLKIHFST